MKHLYILAILLVATLMVMAYYCRCSNVQGTKTPNNSKTPNKSRCSGKNEVGAPQRWAVSNDKIKWLVSNEEDYFGPEGATIHDEADLHLGWVPDHDILRS